MYCPLCYFDPYSEEYDNYSVFVNYLERRYSSIEDRHECIDVEFTFETRRPFKVTYRGTLKGCDEVGSGGTLEYVEDKAVVQVKKIVGYTIETEFDMHDSNQNKDYYSSSSDNDCYSPFAPFDDADDYRAYHSAQGEMSDSEIESNIENANSWGWGTGTEWSPPPPFEGKPYNKVVVKKLVHYANDDTPEIAAELFESIIRMAVKNAYTVCRFSFPDIWF